jgi:hypothetical protein
VGDYPDYCYKCGDVIQYEAVHLYCCKPSSEHESALEWAKSIDGVGRAFKVAVYRNTDDDADKWPWSVTVNVGGWKRGRTARWNGSSITECIATGINQCLSELASNGVRRGR